MKFWYFRFEGSFAQDSPNFGDGVFSSCLIPQSNFQKAKSQFMHALSEQGIILTEIIEYFAVDADDLDPTDEANTFWIHWCEKARVLKQAVFDVWHVYNLRTNL
jgi:hypothetical protein